MSKEFDQRKARQYARYAANSSGEEAQNNAVDISNTYTNSAITDAIEVAEDYTDAAVAGVKQLPAGGTTGQVLTKIDNTDFNVDWETPTGGGGDVSGPASSTDSNFAAFDGTDGKTIKDSGVSSADFDAAGDAAAAQAAAEAYTDTQIAGLSIPANLDDLSDVDAAAPTDGQVLTWVDSDSKWEAVDPTGGGATTEPPPGLDKVMDRFPLRLTGTPLPDPDTGLKYLALAFIGY